MDIKKLGLTLFVLGFFVIGLLSTAALAEEAPLAKGPAVATTCGQSPGALMIKQICVRAGVKCEQNDLITAEDLRKKAENEEGYNTLIITMGTSGKGMGAAGTNMKDEVKRIEGLIKEAKEQGMTVIGAHIEGEARRVDENDAKSIEVVAPQSDIIIVRDDSNKDGYFTDIAEKNDLPFYSVEKTLEVTKPIKEIFNK